MVILDLWGISFHPAVVVGLGNDLLFNSILAHCESTIIKLADCLDIHPLQWNGDIIPYGTTNTIKRNLPFEAYM